MNNALGVKLNPFQLPCIPLKNKGCLPEVPGLYFVIDFSQILYIGRAKNLKKRWSYHHRYVQIKAMAKEPVIAWLDVSGIELLDVENELIFRFKPKLNRTKLKRSNWVKIEQWTRQYSVDFNGFPIVSPSNWQEENANWSKNPSLKGWSYVEDEAETYTQQKLRQLAQITGEYS